MPVALYRLLPFAALAIVYLVGGSLEVMDIDEAQYAGIAREMSDTGQYLIVKDRGQDYLDKPPLLFWVAALCFKLFGVSNLAYRLVPIAFSLLGVYATYRFTRLYYAERAAYWAALVIGSCMAWLLMNRDVRTDNMLTTSVIVGIWLIAEYLQKPTWGALAGGSFFLGLALLAKGPIGLAVPVLAFASHFVAKGQWANFFRPQWLLAVLLVALMLAPMCWGLYQQFGAEGPYFFFWKQSFGRITGENEWKNEVDIFFQAQNFLWSFLPWVLLFVGALLHALGKLLKGTLPEAASLGGFVLPFAALSLSQYQLPHYTFVVFPLGAVLTGVFLHDLIEQKRLSAWYALFRWVQALIALALWAAAGLLVQYSFPIQSAWLWAVLALMLLATVYFVFAPDRGLRLVLPSFMAILGAGLVINAHLFPALFRYQAGSEVGRYVLEQKLPTHRIAVYSRRSGNSQELFSHSLEFKIDHLCPSLPNVGEAERFAAQGPAWIYTDTLGLNELRQAQLQVQSVKEFDKFHVSTLNAEFMNPATRPSTLQKVFLVEVRSK